MAAAFLIFLVKAFTWAETYAKRRCGKIIFDLESLDNDSIKLEFEKDLGTIMSNDFVVFEVVDRTKD